ncbi:unnamed protein product, partial [Meganyctiphanes norvegica]
MKSIYYSVQTVIFICDFTFMISVVEVVAVEGHPTALPCDLHHPDDDAVFLVLFFNDNRTTPIYRYDNREGPDDSSRHWVDETALGVDVQFDVSHKPALLRLGSVRAKDQGFYKCRVDFSKQATKTTRVRLTVIVPPSKVQITAESRPVSSVVGPFMEGDSSSLTCTAYGGNPHPRVLWFIGDRLIDNVMDHESEKFFQVSNELLPVPTEAQHHKKRPRHMPVSNTMTLGPLSRDDLRSLLSCEVSNTNLTQPTTEAVMIDMNLAPLSVDLFAPEEQLSAGRRYELVCEVRGSRPPPTITWYRGTTRVHDTMVQEQTNSDGNITSSTLALTPKPHDDGTTVTCRAENPSTNTVLEQSKAIQVHFIPEAQVRLGSSLNPDNIKEGDDVYFECSILANPKAYKITWQHNGRPLEANPSGGVIVSNQSLVLQRVTRQHAGRYSCTASNIEGDGIASSINLDVKYAPVCAPEQMLTYGVARHEDAEVTCKVNSNPPAQSFKWTFNNTADTIDVPPGRFTTAPAYSIITYTPMTELDYGTLLCWAHNDIGNQALPCLFHIVPAGKPDPPFNCTVSNQSATGFHVSCHPGFDGGLKQIFLLRVAQLGTEGTNVSAGEPEFIVRNLQPGTTYRLQVWSANDKGVSPSVHLQAFTTSQASRPHVGPSEPVKGPVGDGDEGTGIIIPGFDESVERVPALVSMVVGGSVGTILLLLLLVMLIRQRLRGRGPPRQPTPPSTASQQQLTHTTTVQSSPAMTSKIMMSDARSPLTTALCPEREMQVESENEVDPDLIPQKLEHSGLSPSGPLLRPPANYVSSSQVQSNPCCDPGGNETTAGTHRRVVATASAAASGAQHHLAGVTGGAYSHASIITSAAPPLSTHHAHLLPQRNYRHDASSDPRYAHLDLQHSGLVDVTQSRSRGIPTVYATLDTRHASRHAPHSHTQVAYDLRQTHSQASLDLTQDLRYPQHLSHGRSVTQTNDHHGHEQYGQQLVYGHDLSRPLLDDDVGVDIPLVSKRESSV